MDRRRFMETATAAVMSLNRGPLSWSAEPNASSQPSTASLPKRPLGKTGVEVCVLILGGVVAMKEPPTPTFHPAELANAALDAGITYFDTAPSYNNGQSERNYGEVLATRRNEVFLATKTGARDYDGAMREVESSLQRLRVDRLDLLQIHGVSQNEDFSRWEKPDGVLAALYKLRDQKVTRFLGVTGHESAEQMKKAIELFEFDTILTTFNPTLKRRPFEERVLPVAQEKRMGILAMKVMGGGLGSLAVGNPLKNDGASNHDDAPRQANPGLLIRYALGLPVTAAVVGMASREHLRTNLQAAREQPPLTPAEQEALRKQLA